WSTASIAGRSNARISRPTFSRVIASNCSISMGRRSVVVPAASRVASRCGSLSSRLARSSKGLHGHYRNDDGLRQNRGGERIEICALDRGEPFALAVGARGQSTNISVRGLLSYLLLKILSVIKSSGNWSRAPLKKLEPRTKKALVRSILVHSPIADR